MDNPFKLGNVAGPPSMPLPMKGNTRLVVVRTLEPRTRPEDALMVSIAQQAAHVCGTPVGMVSLLEQAEEVVLAYVGPEQVRFSRDDSFCTHTILEPTALAVEDTLNDARFRDNPFVVGEPHIRFYAGAPVFDATGLPLGAVCAVDVLPREASSKCLLALQRLAKAVAAVLETRRLVAQTGPRDAAETEKRSARIRLDALLLNLVDIRAVGE